MSDLWIHNVVDEWDKVCRDIYARRARNILPFAQQDTAIVAALLMVAGRIDALRAGIYDGQLLQRESV